MTANGWDSDGSAGEPGSREAPSGEAPAGQVPAGQVPAGQVPAGEAPAGEAPDLEAPGHDEAGPRTPGLQLPGLLTPDSLVPGMTVRSPALDYMLGRQQRRVRHVATVAASVLAIAIVAAVVAIAIRKGGAGTSNAPQLTAAQVVQQAARRQAALNSESAYITERISGTVNGTISGTVQVERKPLLMAMNIQMTNTGNGQTTAMRGILTDTVMYVKLSAVAGLPKSIAAKWIKVPLTGLSQSSVFSIVRQELQNESPASESAGLSAATDLHSAGSQLVDGVTATRYTGWFAPSAALKELPAAQRAALGPDLRLVKGDIVISVWIDSSGYLREMQETEHVRGTTIELEGTYGSFNEPVKIHLPAPGQVLSPPLSDLND
ncbi:MAG TPA: hypothetical protein VMB74_13845 [Streptosporangiaceae bacterium]|nr:hypothetical protein [Streptosporangiaceae bacterium]